ncbi:MAG: AtpZ/AtpI family protein [Candidatus Krumholzibacteriia bacterium]
MLDRDPDRRGKWARDIGTFTLIPTMMVVGPLLGWWIGSQAEGRWGGDPWFSVGGAIFGLAAAVRQIYLMLTEKDRRR